MSNQDYDDEDEILSFGSFDLHRTRRVLLSEGEKVRIGGRALDVLIELVERAGEVVTKGELMTRAWPHTFVDESNLRVNIAALRKLLSPQTASDRFIVNVPGRGYLFCEPVVRSGRSVTPTVAPTLPSKVPAGGEKLIGRDGVIVDISGQLKRSRLVTVVGPAGVGKSAVLRAACQVLQSEHRLVFIDLSPIADPALLPATLAAGLDVAVLAQNPMANLLDFLREQEVVLVLDNCEHIVGLVTIAVESILRAASGVRFLASSREPLLASTEFVYRVPPLAVPPKGVRLLASEALTYPAVQLFVERAANATATFELGEDEASAVAEICRRLDGLPLAIELVASRADLFSVGGLATDLEERLMLGTRASRTAMPRQQSIRGALDWSHDLLSDTERIVFRRFAIFRGLFSLESAVAITSDDLIPTDTVLDALSLLTAKSLIATEVTATTVRYRLLHVTRAYAREKLMESGELAYLTRRHAEYFSLLLTASEAQWEIMSRSHWLQEFGHALDDVRAALEWAFQPGGDISLGTALLIASLPFGFQLSLIDEFRTRAEKALALLDERDSPLAELRLVSSLTSWGLNTSVDPVELQILFDRVRSLCERVDETKYKIEPLGHQVVFEIENGEYDRAVRSAAELGQSAREAEDPMGVLATERLLAQAHHFAGDHIEARRLAERVIRNPAKVIPLVYSQATIDRQVTMRIVIARTLWIEGNVDQATDLMRETMDLVYRDGPLPVTFALAMGACPIALWTGDPEAASYVSELLAHSRRYTLDRWGSLGEGYREVLDRRSGAAESVTTLDLTVADPVSLMHRMFLATLDPTMLTADLAGRAERGECGWCNPEILRVSGERRLRDGAEGVAAAEELFQRAMSDARKQLSASWELRAGTSLARLQSGQGRMDEARIVLDAVLSDMREGRDTRDVQQALLLRQSLD